MEGKGQTDIVFFFFFLDIIVLFIKAWIFCGLPTAGKIYKISTEKTPTYSFNGKM